MILCSATATTEITPYCHTLSLHAGLPFWSGQRAPVALAHGCGVPRNRGELQTGEETLLERALLVVRDRLQALATAGPLLRQLLAILIAFDSAGLRHSLPPPFFSSRTAFRSPSAGPWPDRKSVV